MECSEVKERLGSYLDREVEPAAAQAMARHFEACESCRKDQAQLQAAIRTAERLLGGYRLSAPIKVGKWTPAIRVKADARFGLPAFVWVALGFLAGFVSAYLLPADTTVLRRITLSAEDLASERILVVLTTAKFLGLVCLGFALRHMTRADWHLRSPGRRVFRWLGVGLLPICIPAFAFCLAETVLRFTSTTLQLFRLWGPGAGMIPEYAFALLVVYLFLFVASFVVSWMDGLARPTRRSAR